MREDANFGVEQLRWVAKKLVPSAEQTPVVDTSG